MAEFAAVLTAFLTATAELPAAPQPKPTEEAREAAPPLPRRRRRRGAPGELPAWAWAGIVGVSAALAVAIGAWLVALARPSFGEVRVELRPPSARVEVRVDGEPVAGDLENLVLKLPVGPHTLEVSGENYRPVTMQFPVRSSDNPPVVVVLEQVPSPQSPALPIAREQEKAPSGPPAGGSDAPPNAPKAKAPAPPPDAAAKKPAPPPGPPALRWERQDDLVGGRIKAPNFNAPKVLFQDDFKNPTSGFLNSQLDGKWYAGRTAKGRFSPFYAIQPKKGVAWAESQVPLGPANTPDPADPFEIKVVGRAVGRAGSWGVGLGDAEASNMLDVNLILYHKPMLGGSIVGYWRDLTPRPDLPLREGVSRELRLVVSGRYVEVYIDGVAACDPILLKRGLGKPRFYLGANAPNRDGKFQAEFSAVQVMSGRSLAPVTARGAVPK